MVRPPREHVRSVEGNGDCLLASVCTATEGTTRDYHEAKALGGPYMMGDMRVGHLPGLLLSRGYAIYPPLVSFSVNPWDTAADEEDKVGAQAAQVSIAPRLLTALEAAAMHQKIDIDRLVSRALHAHLVALGYRPDEVDHSTKNGLVDESLNPKKKAGFTINIPIECPALVAVQTDSDCGHLVYWSGDKVYDPNLKDPLDSFEGYTVSMWFPIQKLIDPYDCLADLIARKEQRQVGRDLLQKFFPDIDRPAGREGEARMTPSSDSFP